MPKVLAMVLHSDAHPWGEIGKVQRDTWMAALPDGCDALQYVGGAAVDARIGQRLELAIPEPGRVEQLGPKTARAFRWALANCDFDYMIRTNNGSYVDMALLQAMLADAPRTRYYGGHHPHRPDFRPLYARGDAAVMSHDVVEEAAKTDMAATWDDIEMGAAAARIGAQLVPLGQLWLTNGARLAQWRAAGKPRHYHYRLKGEGRSRPQWDCAVMREVHGATLE